MTAGHPDTVNSKPVSFADITTMRIGGRIGKFIQPASRAEFILSLVDADSEHLPLCVIGGGSNMLVSDDDFNGVVVRDARRKVSILDEAVPAGPGEPKLVHVEAEAGTNWDDFVEYTIRMGMEGIEGLSGIPGTVGASVVQNIGAYGQEAASAVSSVQVWDRKAQKVINLRKEEMGFGYRTSLLKKTMYEGMDERTNRRTPSQYFPSPRYIVLSVVFELRHSATGVVGMAQLAKALQARVGERIAASDIRTAVLQIRTGKGMVEDPSRYGNPWMKGTKDTAEVRNAHQADGIQPDYDRWSCGSFFVNPVITPAQADAVLPVDAPRFESALPDGSEGIKASAAWLIDRAGFHKGFTVNGRAALSSRHTLALTNRGGARSDDIVRLARTIREGVQQAFNIDLVPEPVFIGL